MNASVIIEERLQRTAGLLRMRRVLQHTATAGCVASVVVLILGIAMVRGWMENVAVVSALLVALGFGGFLAWLIVMASIMTKSIPRKSLAASLEGGDSRLLDRLNTLVFLEKNRRADVARWFFTRIARQTGGVLEHKSAPAGISFARPFIHLCIFIFLFVSTCFFYAHFHPWARLAAADADRRARNTIAQKNPTVALPTNNVTEENKAWGEVRITDPARDLKVTKVDVVPLQIEAAASQSLKQISWFSTVNGGVESSHVLPSPPEPRYAVYQPMVYLDEYHLADWDVLTYYAKARTQPGDGYASDIYFLEVRPFREDILKMPGGEGGKAYQTLSEMTSLIERQQHIIRETHQYEQSPDAPANLRQQDRQKLADGEDDLDDSVRHLYAKMTTDMENQPIGEALDNLAKAQHALDDSSRSLLDNIIPDAQGHERSALTDLIAARKMFQKAVSDHPDSFKDKPENEERDPMADSAKQLGDIAEFRNETKAARDFVKKTAEEQRKLAGKVAATPRLNQTNLATDESKLQKSLADFEQQHPQMFRQATNETTTAAKSLDQAVNALEKRTGGQRATSTAADDLDKLAAAMNRQAEGRDLGDAYKLKKVLDKQMDALNEMQRGTNDLSSEQRQQAATASKETMRQLREITESKTGTNNFGPELHDSLTGTNKSSVDSQLNKLASAQNKQDQKDAAGEARKGLQNISEAFKNSLPTAMQAAQKHDSLNPGGQEGFQHGMAQLESLKQQLESGHPLSAGQQQKEMNEAASALEQGLTDLYGHDDQAQKLVALVDDTLKEKGKAPDMVTLKKLMDQLRNFSVEVADKQGKKENPEITNIDPSRLPPAYRGRIEKYYEKLSERKP
ncbi:MAG TPA: hypothetical protein VH413_11675 [Verrucomicrobiae bacterium]|jgi:hypothetical protein|nr:hypothetical protein [Verrucomicrobiae bacterium]